jgi:PAS domain S-box-containing protein
MIAVELQAPGRSERGSRVSALPQLLCIAGFDGRFKSLSNSWETALDYSLAELRSCRFYEFIHPEDVAATMDEVRRLACGGFGGTLQNRFCRRDGTYRTLLWSAQPIVTDRAFFAVASDVTGEDPRLVRRYLRR